MSGIEGGLFLIAIIGLAGFAAGCFVAFGSIIYLHARRDWPLTKKETVVLFSLMIAMLMISAYVDDYYSPYETWR